MRNSDEFARPGGAVDTITGLRPSRRTVALGAAWSVPAVALAAPAAHAGISTCTVSGSIQVGPNIANTGFRAICSAQSQELQPATIHAGYGVGDLPQYLEICNCQNEPAWYRWREVDSLDSFQIEVDGVHVDQNSSQAGWRAAFYLPGFGEAGGCKRFNLGYRTSVSRTTTFRDFTIDFTLQRGTSQNGPWTTVATVTRAVRVRRTTNDAVNFNSCSSQGLAARSQQD